MLRIQAFLTLRYSLPLTPCKINLVKVLLLMIVALFKVLASKIWKINVGHFWIYIYFTEFNKWCSIYYFHETFSFFIFFIIHFHKCFEKFLEIMLHVFVIFIFNTISKSVYIQLTKAFFLWEFRRIFFLKIFDIKVIFYKRWINAYSAEEFH